LASTRRARATTAPPDWADEIHRRLQQWSIRQVAVVPDTGQKRLISLCAADPTWRMVTLTTEEEGIALLAGAWLGGERGVLLLQSSGVGNCFNMLAMNLTCRFPLLMIVTMRGEWNEFNPWMMPLGKAMQAMLERMGVVCVRAERPEDAGPATDAAAKMAFEGPQAVALLLTQTLVSAKRFTP
jgi:sulfopyruvate decarboxylase alpha subunit